MILGPVLIIDDDNLSDAHRLVRHLNVRFLISACNNSVVSFKDFSYDTGKRSLVCFNAQCNGVSSYILQLSFGLYCNKSFIKFVLR